MNAPSSEPRKSIAERVSVWLRRTVKQSPSWGSSLIVHAIFLLILGLITITQPGDEDVYGLRGMTIDDSADDLEPFEAFPDVSAQIADTAPRIVDSATLAETSNPADAMINDLEFAVIETDTGLRLPMDKHFSGRTAASRAARVAREGGSVGSEAAVARGLKWIAKHQKYDGSWSFNHHTADCDENCGNPGSLSQCTTGATAFALLCLFGAGQTNTEGDYQKSVQRGIAYLNSQMKITNRGGDLRGVVVANEGMYAHGLATIAMCEAYSMTSDRQLKRPAQQAINFIVSAQGRQGGWRYQPGQPGDLSVVGWQVMAMTSGRIAKLRIPGRNREKAWRFLNKVQTDGGAMYGYTGPGGTPTMTAVGLLCRMYLGRSKGWNKEHKALQKGIGHLSKWGPSHTDMYYNYYATQVMYQWGGEPWKKWNAVLRDHVVKLQIKNGHAAGSWDPIDPRGTGPGGRLYMTAMCIMTLEVYYRHLPLYERR